MEYTVTTEESGRKVRDILRRSMGVSYTALKSAKWNSRIFLNGEAVRADSTGKVFTLPNGDVITITATAEGVKDVADNAEKNNTYTYTIKNGATNTEGNYESVTKNVGTLTINPKKVTITAKDASKPYDGSPLTQPLFEASVFDEREAAYDTAGRAGGREVSTADTQPNEKELVMGGFMQV